MQLLNCLEYLNLVANLYVFFSFSSKYFQISLRFTQDVLEKKVIEFGLDGVTKKIEFKLPYPSFIVSGTKSEKNIEVISPINKNNL